MQKITQIIQNHKLATASGIHASQESSVKTRATLSNSQPTEPNRKRIDRLFLSFTAFYGQLWRSQFKSDEFLNFMKNEWFQALQEVEDKNIEEAIINCRDKKQFPPT